MFTLTVPNFAALALALLQLVLLCVACLGRPQAVAQRLGRIPLFVLLLGTLAGLMILLDYGEWKEGYATRGQLRRAIAIHAFTEFAEQQLELAESADCVALLDQSATQYQQLAEELSRWHGTALPLIGLSELRAPDPCAQLQEFLWQARIHALQSELDHDFSRGVGTYFSDRLFDGD